MVLAALMIDQRELPVSCDQGIKSIQSEKTKNESELKNIQSKISGH